MKKIVSVILITTILAGAFFSVASLPTTAYAKEERSVKGVIEETAATASCEAEVEYSEREETELPLTAASEVTENVQEAEVFKVPEATEENVPAHNEQVLDSLPTFLEEYDVSILTGLYKETDVDVSDGINILTFNAMYDQCQERDADVRLCVVEHEGSYYLVVEWSNNRGRGYVHVLKAESVDGEEYFFSFGEDFCQMVRETYDSKVKMD